MTSAADMSEDYYKHERRDVLRFLPREVQTLLDIGCSEGAFGAAVMQSHPGAQVWGVEPVKQAADVAATRLTRVLNDYFSESLALPDAFFDVITFNDSLEHMPDEHAALRIAYRKLRPGGVLVCSVPNVRYLENLRHLLVEADWKYEDAGILDRTHLRFFTKKSIRRAVEQSGFVVSEVTGVSSHWWTGWSVRLLRLLFRHHVEDTRWQQFIVVATR